jgi:hypothetical protein
MAVTLAQTAQITYRDLNMLEWLADYFARESRGGKKPAHIDRDILRHVAYQHQPLLLQSYGISVEFVDAIGGIDGISALLERQDCRRYFCDTFTERNKEVTHRKSKQTPHQTRPSEFFLDEIASTPHHRSTTIFAYQPM